MTADGLRADVGLLDAVAIEVGLIVGAGLFSLTGVAAGLAGPALPLSYALAVVAVSFGLVPTAVLGAAYPTTGGNYRYPSRLWSPRAAFVAAWGLAASMFAGGLPLYAISFGEYLSELVPVDVTLVALAVLTAFYVVNLLGVRVAALTQTLLFVSLLASLLVFVGFGAPQFDAAHFDGFAAAGVLGTATGTAVLYFVCLGANFVVDIGGEIRDATATIPRSFAVSVPTVFVLYVLVAVVAVGAVGAEALAGETLDVPARVVLSPGLRTFFVVGGALFAIATSVNAVYLVAPKYLLVMAEDDLLPAGAAAVNDRFGTPHVGLTAVYLVSVAAVLSPLHLADLGSMLGFGGILLVVVVMVAAVRFARDHPEDHDRVPFAVRPRLLTGLAVAAVACNVLLFAVLGVQSSGVLAIWAALLVVGAGYYEARRRYLAGRGTPIRARMTEL